MVGIWQSYAGLYLIIAGIVMLIAFGMPLVLAPMKWAQLFRWDASHPGNLVIFLGRSLGVMISIIAIYALKVSQVPAAMPFYFELMLWIFGGMLILHIYGAIRKTQPFTETIEIAVWIILFIITLLIFPG